MSHVKIVLGIDHKTDGIFIDGVRQKRVVEFNVDGKGQDIYATFKMYVDEFTIETEADVNIDELKIPPPE